MMMFNPSHNLIVAEVYLQRKQMHVWLTKKDSDTLGRTHDPVL